MQKELLSLKSFVLKFCWNPSLMLIYASLLRPIFDSLVFYGGGSVTKVLGYKVKEGLAHFWFITSS